MNAAPTFSLASSFIHYSSTRVVRSFSSFFFFFLLSLIKLHPLCLAVFSFSLLSNLLGVRFSSRTTDLPPVQQPDGVTPSFSYLSYLTRAPLPRTAFYHVPSPPHAPFSTFLVVAVPSDNDDNDSPRRRVATRVHGTRIMEVFSAKVKLSGAKA